jgi:hypothetical protein
VKYLDGQITCKDSPDTFTLAALQACLGIYLVMETSTVTYSASA